MVRNDFQGIRYRIAVGYAPGVYEIYGEFPFFHEVDVSRCFLVHCQQGSLLIVYMEIGGFKCAVG